MADVQQGARPEETSEGYQMSLPGGLHPPAQHVAVLYHAVHRRVGIVQCDKEVFLFSPTPQFGQKTCSQVTGEPQHFS